MSGLLLAGAIAVALVALLAAADRSDTVATDESGGTDDPDALATRIDALLPQTQCGQCGFAGCQPYARAMAEQRADINQCPPGGEATIAALAQLLQRPAKPLNPDNGVEKPKRLARIDESRCIGCTKCILACPVDAIVGASKLMHTVIAEDCTGCELCLPPCPVDCIDLVDPADALPLQRVRPPGPAA
jgi:electron transport complex protein RnfB